MAKIEKRILFLSEKKRDPAPGKGWELPHI
jgi:hypothetical protein